MIENCPMRHENGNCIPAGGFCTANKNICEALLNAYRMGKAQLSKQDTTFDLISRQETIDRFNVIRPADQKKDEYTKGIDVGIAMCIVAVKDQPTIQPEPTDEQVEEYCKRRCLHIVTDDFFHTVQPEPQEGEWVLKDHLWECNKCGCRINVKNPLCENNWNYYFCPHCGTKMIIAVQRF